MQFGSIWLCALIASCYVPWSTHVELAWAGWLGWRGCCLADLAVCIKCRRARRPAVKNIVWATRVTVPRSNHVLLRKATDSHEQPPTITYNYKQPKKSQAARKVRGGLIGK